MPRPIGGGDRRAGQSLDSWPRAAPVGLEVKETQPPARSGPAPLRRLATQRAKAASASALAITVVVNSRSFIEVSRSGFVPADEEAGTGPVRLALDHDDRADRLVGVATGGTAGRLRLACTAAPPQAGIRRLITSDSFPPTRRRRRCCVCGHRPHRPAGRPCNVA